MIKVVVDYSTSWCGPCKIIEPKFIAMSETYEDVVFLKVSARISAAIGEGRRRKQVTES